MRAVAIIPAVLLVTTSVAVRPVDDPEPAAVPPAPQVVSVTRVSPPTPFADNCGSLGFAVEGAEVEPHLSVDPRNPQRLLATWQQDRYVAGGARSNLAAVSHDGGRTWHVDTLPGLSACTDGTRLKASDPWTAIGADGTAYVSSFAVTDPAATDAGNPTAQDFDGDTVVHRSTPSGMRWQGPAMVAADDGLYWHEKAVMTADPRDADTLYAAWARHVMPDPVPLHATTDVATAFSRSRDGGRHWTDPVILPGLPGVNEWPFGGLLTLPATEGPTPLVVISTGLPARIVFPGCVIYATRSDDGGQSWSSPVPIAAPPVPVFNADYEQGSAIRAEPCIASGASAPDGTLYVVWYETAVAAGDPTGSRIMLARSDDGGRTWESTQVAASPRLAFLPTVAVAGDGTVGVSYMDTGEDALGDEELTTRLRFAASGDRGGTWQRIDASESFDLRTAPNAGGYMLGDYDGLVGLPDGFGALVVLARPLAEHGPTDVFYVRIGLDGRRS